MDKLTLKRDHLDSYVTKEIIIESTGSAPVNGKFGGKLCDGDLCCTFSGAFNFKNSSKNDVRKCF